MKDKIKKLERKYGSKRKAAAALGISIRHLYRVAKYGTNNKTLQKLIAILAET